MTAREHNKLLSIFFLIQGGLQLIGGLFAALIYGGAGIMMLASGGRNGEQAMGGIFIVLAVVVGVFILLFAAFYLFTGMRLIKEKPIGRTLGIIASCLALLGFPLGTALGIYGLWFFFGDVGKNFYAGLNGGYAAPTPPIPNSWQ